MEKLRKILSLMLVSLLVFSPLPAKGESPYSHETDIKTLKKNVTMDSRPLKNPLNWQADIDYDDPDEYPLVSKGKK